jgi:hypothetical protein
VLDAFDALLSCFRTVSLPGRLVVDVREICDAVGDLTFSPVLDRGEPIEDVLGCWVVPVFSKDFLKYHKLNTSQTKGFKEIQKNIT